MLFTGQGSQFVGMGRDLARAHPQAAQAFERANDILDIDLRRICWEGPEEDLTRTENAQPAILLHSYAVWICLPEAVRRSVTIAAGHSLGEFTAYLAAGMLDFADALRIVRRRGELMGRAGRERPGTMAALIGLDSEIRPLLRAYSMTSAIYDDHLEFFSIKVPNGPLTSRLQYIRVGDEIIVNGKPTGTLLVSNLRPGRRLWLFATGTGFAPFASILRDPETYEQFETVIAVEGCRQAAELEFATRVVTDVRQKRKAG